MIKAKGSSGREKAPKQKLTSVFAGIKGLVASGPGTKKTPKLVALRPEKNEAAKIGDPFKK